MGVRCGNAHSHILVAPTVFDFLLFFFFFFNIFRENKMEKTRVCNDFSLEIKSSCLVALNFRENSIDIGIKH